MFKKLMRWIKILLSDKYLLELAEMYLASGKVSPEDATMIRLMIEEIKSSGIDKVAKKEIRRKLRKLLSDYLRD